MSESLLTDQEAADYLRLSLYTTQKYLRQGKLRGIKTGRAWKVSASALKEFEEQGGTAKTEPTTK